MGDFLTHAVGRGDLAIIEFLLELGVDINRNRHTPTAHHAAYYGQLEALRLVMARGADPRIRDERFGATALGWARHAGQAAAAARLEAHGLEE